MPRMVPKPPLAAGDQAIARLLRPSRVPVSDCVTHSPGQPLDAPTRGHFEARFGHDFSDVRVHTDATAARSAEHIAAVAYTVGHDIVLGASQFQFRTGPLAEWRVLAHELAHVVQQRGGGEPPGPAQEAEADAAVRAIETGTMPGVQARCGVGLAAQAKPGAVLAGNDPAPDPSVPLRKNDRENVHRLAVAHLRWEQTKQIAAEDLQVFALVEIVTGHWLLRSERYDLFMKAFNRGPHTIQLDDLPDNAMDFFFVSPREFEAEYEIRLKTAVARMEACGGGRWPRPSEVACIEEVWADVTPTEFARKQRGYVYWARGDAAAEGAIQSGNPAQMGALVFAHNILGWSPERSAEFGSFVAAATSIAAAKYARTVIARGQQRAEPSAPAGREFTPAPPDPAPRTAAQVITGLAQAPQVETPSAGEAKVSPAVLFGDYLEHGADAVREARMATSTAPGPALATATSEPYGHFHSRVNEDPDRQIHPLLAGRIELVEDLPRPRGEAGHYWKKGSQEHAEILAVSDAIYALEDRLGRSVTWEEARKQIELDIIRKKTGAGMPRCARCMLVLEGIKLTDRTKEAERAQSKRLFSGREQVR